MTVSNVELGISFIESYLPEQTITSQELSEKFGFDLSFVQDKLGVKQLYQSAPDEKTSDLGAKALTKIFDRIPEAREKMGLLVLVTQTPDFRLPHTSSVILDKASIKRSLPCFDISLGCSGWVYGLSVVQSFMKANQIEYGALITAETYTKYLDPEDRNTKCLFSDGATATWISPDGNWKPGRFTFGSKPDHYRDLLLENSNEDRAFLQMNGPNIFQFAVKEIPRDVRDCMGLNQLKISDLDAVVFHQANRYMIRSLATKLDIPREKLVDYMEEFGNTVSSTIPMAFSRYLEQNPNASTVLVSGFGVGLSWASTVLRGKTS